MSVCVLNDVGPKHHFLGKTKKFESFIPTPWKEWDAKIEEIIDLVLEEGEFQAVALNLVIWKVMRQFMIQSSADVLLHDGNVFVALYAIRQYLCERLCENPFLPELCELMDVATDCAGKCFRPPTEFVNVLVQTGGSDNSLKVFTTERFFSWYNENDLCENYAFNTAIEFEEFEKGFIEQLSNGHKATLYPELASKTASRLPFTSFF